MGESAASAGFVGFGEVAAVFAAALRGAGIEVSAYDALCEDAEGAGHVRARDPSGKVRFEPLDAVLASAEVVFSTVTSASALDAARSCAPHLGADHLYLDLNATAPDAKRAIADIVEATGARFVEGALLGAVGVAGARTRILLGGRHREVAAALLAGFGLNGEPYHEEIGRASAFKLLRSVFSKGIEALLVEFLVAGRRAGLDEELWAEVAGLFRKHPFDEVALEWVRTHGAAHARRGHEARDAAALVRALGVEPRMCEAAVEVFAHADRLGLAERLGGMPADWNTVVAALAAAAGEEE